MTLDEITALLQRGVDHAPLKGSLKFDCGDDGVVVLEDKTANNIDRAADCTIKITLPNMAKLVKGKLNPMTGVMTGKLKVSGDARIAMKLGELLKS
ncbi:SCP2 sterol-binding domain-containing protein [Yoonia maritima]|uniref:SCP2 sterol-binding domain-containing protein n=1 Tax=Yoonia maritima TaxID=1435347 RepID=UPI000D114995|nr:SCP2 sterol-binding domain-containing protein [Yoonia maritima]